MNFSRQALLGIGMIIGGSVMLYAMVQQIGDSNKTKPASAMIEKQSPAQESPQPLTTDIETEKRILAQKQKERAARVAEQERRAQQFLSEQEAAEAQALAKARAESQQYLASTAPANDKEAEDSKEAETDTATAPKSSADSDNTATATESDNSAREQQKAAIKEREAQLKAAIKEQEARIKTALKEQEAAKGLVSSKTQKAAEVAKNEAPKSPTDYQVKKGDGLIKLARQHNMPVEVLAQANNLSPSTSLQLGQSLTIPSRQQVDRLAREAAAAEQAREDKRQKEEALAKKSADAKREAQQKLSEARKEVKETDAKGSFGVQVALANDQAKADELAKKFQSAGYQVKTSPTSRGVRVIVGPERGKVAALALKDKINSDPKVNTTSAWVLYWR